MSTVPEMVSVAIARSLAKQYTDKTVTSIGTGFKPKGEVATKSALPSSASAGDCYAVKDENGALYARMGDAWVHLDLASEEAKNYASAAGTSASNSAISASESATSASESAISASASAESATSSHNYATAALSSKMAAETSANQASTSANNASVSATAASNYKTQAGNSAVEAAEYAEEAKNVVWKGTQEQYNALTTINPNCIYFIVNEV